MSPDPVVAEIHAIRERLAAKFGFDVREIGRDARQRDAVGDRKIVRRPPRPVAQLPRVSAKSA